MRVGGTGDRGGVTEAGNTASTQHPRVPGNQRRRNWNVMSHIGVSKSREEIRGQLRLRPGSTFKT